jgi:hypothetical protein
MKALTLQPEWARLVAMPDGPGAKRCENRAWPTAHRGLLAIHAGQPVGAVVAVARLIDCVAFERHDSGAPVPGEWRARHPWFAQDPHAHGPWVWVLVDVRVLLWPVPCKGQLKLWDLPDDVAAQVLASLAGTA